MKTAVEWLYERLERMIPRTALYDVDKKEYYEKAKEMEKEQISKAYEQGSEDGYWHPENGYSNEFESADTILQRNI
jgi:hypothetical protein